MGKNIFRSGGLPRIGYYSIFVALLCDLASSLPCHCLNGTQCNVLNGFCPNGCEKGWYGPGCQIGNHAFGKPALQSSTAASNLASLAVDGLLESASSEQHCSHTADGQTSNAWWYVTLSVATEVYQITNITIANRNGPFAYRLSNFYILYTNDTSGDPNPNSWSTCAYSANSPSATVSSYSCTSLAVGKKVAVYLGQTKENLLALCEVYIYGFLYQGCPNNYVGPGCLLQNCYSDACTLSSSPCDVYGGCKFTSCPTNRFLPPGCWITIPQLLNASVTTTPKCNNLQVSMTTLVQDSDLAATSYLIQVDGSGIGVNTTVRVAATTSGLQNINVPASPNRLYNIRVLPEICISSIGCPYSYPDGCLPMPGSGCTIGLGTKGVKAHTGFRTYHLRNDDSCINVIESSSTQDCEEPVSILLQCEFGTQMSSFSNGSSTRLCGLVQGASYYCVVNATISDGSVDSYAEIVHMKVSPSPGSNAAIIGGTVGGILVVIAIVVAVVVSYRRKINVRRSRSDIIHLSPNHQKLESAVSTEESMNCNEPMYGNTFGMNLQQFDLYVKAETVIANRFSEIVANENHSCIAGKDPANKLKNRFNNIIPYDATRVMIGLGTNGYINASYINGFSQPKKYIATQGPSVKTVNDFWQMVWEQHAVVIVMLTNFVESSKKKCEVYFPKPGSEEFPISVTIRSQTIYDTHTISILDVQCGTESRTVSHYHLLCWKDHSVPEHFAEVITFYAKLSAHVKNLHLVNSPMIVHCSAGVGRTGTFIAFDYLQSRYEASGHVDVDSCLVALRDQRMQMVQTKEQYLFLHKITLYGMKTLQFIFDSSLLSAYVKNLSQRSQPNDSLAKEWKVLQGCRISANNGDFSIALLEENVVRNRDREILASDSKRTIVSGSAGATQSPYINAVYCNGCYSDKEFIATQLPLPDTLSDFWQMVYTCQAGCIVLLHDMPPSQDCPEYWPKAGETQSFGQYVVSHIGCKETLESAAYHELDLSVHLSTHPSNDKMEELRIKLFLLNMWSWDSEVPKQPHLLLDFVVHIREFFKSTAEHPIILQCRDGASHCGLFIAAVNALHRLIDSNLVQVFHSVDLVRASRQQFVKSHVQYLFIYEFLQTYCDTLAVYANA